jgi:hypothetical protein
MTHVHLNAREWLESRRLAGCEWAPGLLDLMDGESEFRVMAAALEDIRQKAPYIVNGSKLDLHEHQRIADWACGRLDLLESLEEIIEEFADGFTCANGTRPVDPDDLLRAMFESDRWQQFDL